MRLLFWTDPHLDEKPPLARSDSYCEDIFRKMEELAEIARTVDVSLLGGDLFHRTRPSAVSHRLVRRLIEFLRHWPTDLYAIAGNHDLPADGMDGIQRTPLGVVLEALKDGPVQLLDEPASFTDPALTIWPVHWQHDIDSRPDLYSVTKLSGTDFLVLVSHGMVMPPGGGWPFPAVGMDQIETEADVVLLGHMHWMTGAMEVNGTLFVGPGAIARTARSESELRRTVHAAVLELEKGKKPQVEFVPLKSMRPASEVFVWTEGPERPTGELFAGYVAALEVSMGLEGMSVEEVLAQLEKQADPAVVKLTREYLERSGL